MLFALLPLVPASSGTPFADARTKLCFTRADIPVALNRTYDDVVRRIHSEIWLPENGFKSGDTVNVIAERVKGVVAKAAKFAKVNDKISMDLLRAETVICWVRTNVDYWSELPSRPAGERAVWDAPEKVLSHRPRPKAICGGFGFLVTALGNEVGVRTEGVGGTLRKTDGGIDVASDVETVAGLPWNHGWNIFIINDKILPADTSNSWKFGGEEFRKGWRGKTDSMNSLPLDMEEWDLFLGTHRLLQREGVRTETDPLSSMNSQGWKTTETHEFEKRRQRLRIHDTERNKRLESSS